MDGARLGEEVPAQAEAKAKAEGDGVKPRTRKHNLFRLAAEHPLVLPDGSQPRRMFSLTVLPSTGGFATGHLDGRVLRWSKDGQLEATLIGHENLVRVLVLRALLVTSEPPRVSLVSGSKDNTVRVWENDACIAVLRGHTGEVMDVAVHPADPNVVVSGSADKTVVVWDVTAETPTSQCRANGRVFGVGVLSGGLVVSASRDGAVTLWHPVRDVTAPPEAATVVPEALLVGQPALTREVRCVKVGPDGASLNFVGGVVSAQGGGAPAAGAAAAGAAAPAAPQGFLDSLAMPELTRRWRHEDGTGEVWWVANVPWGFSAFRTKQHVVVLEEQLDPDRTLHLVSTHDYENSMLSARPDMHTVFVVGRGAAPDSEPGSEERMLVAYALHCPRLETLAVMLHAWNAFGGTSAPPTTTGDPGVHALCTALALRRFCRFTAEPLQLVEPFARAIISFL